MTNSTLSGNSATNDGGGIYNGNGTVNLTNTIVASNTASSGPDISGLIVSHGHNLIDNTSGSSGFVPSDQQNASPALGPLASNGGPTQTFALLAGSPAIGAGDATICAQPLPPPVLTGAYLASGNGTGSVDQRGFPRPAATCSIGAFEAIQTYTADSISDTGTAGTLAQCLDPTNTACRLRDAIGDAASGSDTIVFNSTGRGTITVGSTLTLTASVTITGPTSGAGVTVQAAATPKTAAYGVFVVNSGVTANMSALTIANGNRAGNGGGIFNKGILTVTNSTLSGNSATYGGGIENAGTLTVTNSTLADNSANGGGINNDGTLTVTNSTLSGNSASFGGGILNDGTVNVTNSTLSGNSGGDLTGTPAATTSHNLIGSTPPPLLAPLGSYGGPTQTIALLPDSPAIDAGDDAICASTGPTGVNNKDQRGVTRPVGAHCDIGAFESQGFTLTKTGGDNQRTLVGTAFTNPLVVTVAPSAAGAADNEPVNRGAVTFTGPGSGADIAPDPQSATITAGQASITPTANTVAGSYSVTASASGAAAVTFALTNIAPTIILSPPTLPAAAGGIAYPPTTLMASGGTTPYTFTVTTGTLPTGLTLTTAGLLSSTPTAAGSFTFTVTATDANGFTGTQQYTITITAAPLTRIALTSSSGSPSAKVGQTVPFTAMGTYADGSTQNLTNQVQWSSSNPQVAKVDAAGKVTGESPGTVTIMATLNGVTQTITVTIGAPTPVGIVVAPAPAARPAGATSSVSPGAPPPAPIPTGR